MNEKQKRLSEYIDQLNSGKKPEEHGTKINDADFERLMETVRRVRVLREIEFPTEDYPVQLVAGVKDRVLNAAPGIMKDRRKREVALLRRIVFFATAAVAAAAIIIMVPKLILPSENIDIVYAMEKAFEELEAYHGRITVIESNEIGDTMTQAVREVWADREGNYFVKELEGTAKGIITINNGEKKWQLRPEEKISYLFATFPDPYRFTFELAQEIDEVKDALTVQEIGEDVIAGRNTIVLQVTPKGGNPYRLWVDRETKLPLQRETAMHNSIGYLVTYNSIEFISEIPKKLLSYQLPEGFTEVDIDAEQVVNTIEEAEEMTGFWSILPGSVPKGYSLSKITFQKEKNALRFYYTSDEEGNVIRIEQSMASQELIADPMAILGKVNGNKAELLVQAEANSVRWMEDGLEISVVGTLSFEELMPFLQELTKGKIELPAGVLHSDWNGTSANADGSSSSVWKEPEVKTEIDLAMEENEQKSVDAGHSPWKLDPVFVAQVFASLLLSPEGIIGEYPISYEDIEIIENDGNRAIAWIKSDKSKADYIYLERLIRRDETGIWTVIGYDKVD